MTIPSSPSLARSEEQNHILIASVQLPNGIAQLEGSQFETEKGGKFMGGDEYLTQLISCFFSERQILST